MTEKSNKKTRQKKLLQYLFDVPVKRAFLAEYVGAVRAHDTLHSVEPAHVCC